MNKKQKNNELRVRFHNYHTINFQPNVKVVALAIGIHPTDFYKWKNSKHDYDFPNLSKIENFLESKGF